MSSRSTDQVEQGRISEDDRVWFEQHPARRYRLRGPYLAEIDVGMICNSTVRVLVRSMSPGVRLRLRVRLRPGETGDDEAACRQVWRRAAAPYAELHESQLRRLAEAAGAAP